MKKEETKFYDSVFSADRRATSEGYAALAGWLTIEQLQKLAPH